MTTDVATSQVFHSAFSLLSLTLVYLFHWPLSASFSHLTVVLQEDLGVIEMICRFPGLMAVLPQNMVFGLTGIICSVGNDALDYTVVNGKGYV